MYSRRDSFNYAQTAAVFRAVIPDREACAALAGKFIAQKAAAAARYCFGRENPAVNNHRAVLHKRTYLVHLVEVLQRRAESVVQVENLTSHTH